MGMHPEPRPQGYQIRVRGRLGQTLRFAFPALEAQVEGGDTVLTGHAGRSGRTLRSAGRGAWPGAHRSQSAAGVSGTVVLYNGLGLPQ